MTFTWMTYAVNLTLTLTSNIKVTERSRKTSVGRQSDSIINSTAHHPTANFSDASRGPTPSVIPYWKPLMTPNLDPNSDAKILQIFGNPFLQTQSMKTSRYCTPPSVIPYWKPPMTQLESKFGCKILQFFLQQIFATPLYTHLRRPL